MPSGTHLRFCLHYQIGVSITGGTPWASFLQTFDYLADDPVDYEAAAVVLWDHFTPVMRDVTYLHCRMHRATVRPPSASASSSDIVVYEPSPVYGTLFTDSPDHFLAAEHCIIVRRSFDRHTPAGRGRVYLPPTVDDFISEADQGIVDTEHPALADVVMAVGWHVLVGGTYLVPSLYNRTTEAMTPITDVRVSPWLGRQKRRRPLLPWV